MAKNAHGEPGKPLPAAKDALGDISHCPAVDFREALAELGDLAQYDAKRILLCNGASDCLE